MAFLFTGIALTAIWSCRHAPVDNRQVIVLAIDGMDPGFLERHWSALPNLDYLRNHGDFRRLGTTTPPQTPVAFATFITGLEPTGHGIFDFVHRDPGNLQLFTSIAKTEEARFKIALGSYVIPLSSARITPLRKGRTFWEVLSEHSVPVAIIHMPTNFPPVESGEGISGMGTPDLEGTLGTFTFYTDDAEQLTRPVSGGRIVRVTGENGRFVLSIRGPSNTLRKDQRAETADLIVDVDAEWNAARLSLDGETAIVKKGEWSDWLSVHFPLIPGLAGSAGIVRVFAKEFHPQLELYVTPVNIDPRSPVLPISSPQSYSHDVANQIGPFYTQGIAEDTSAVRQGVFDLPEYLQQSSLVRNDELKLLHYSLDHYNRGLLFFYFSSIDQDSHMLWGKHDSELLETYRAIDSAIGEVAKKQPRASIIVMSDHGFNSFDNAVNLNTWLWKEGFLSRKNHSDSDDKPFAEVEWPQTRAYAVGLNGLYINLAGREKQGIVKPGQERVQLIREIREKLLRFRDPARGLPVITSVATSDVEPGPDMIIGYARGYRASWETALGSVPFAPLEPNRDLWIGDHCIDAAEVPGVLLSNRKIRAKSPELKDLTVTILRLFDAPVGRELTGRNIF